MSANTTTIIGNTVNLAAQFTFESIPEDPDEVTIEVKLNGKDYARASYPGAIQRLDVGSYTWPLVCKLPGNYTYLYVGTGPRVGRATGLVSVNNDF